MLGCNHCPILLDESPNTKAPTLVICALCEETLEAVKHEPQRPITVRYVIEFSDCIPA